MIPTDFCDCSKFSGDFHLVRSKRDAYHPRFIGSFCAAIREAQQRCREDRAGVSVIYHPPDEQGRRPPIGVSSASRRVARVPWSAVRGRCLPVRIERDLCAGGGWMVR